MKRAGAAIAIWDGMASLLTGRSEYCGLVGQREQVDDVGVYAVFVHLDNAERDGQFKTAGAAGAGVEIEHFLAVLDGGAMGVTVEDGGEFGGGGIEVEGAEVME